MFARHLRALSWWLMVAMMVVGCGESQPVFVQSTGTVASGQPTTINLYTTPQAQASPTSSGRTGQVYPNGSPQCADFGAPNNWPHSHVGCQIGVLGLEQGKGDEYPRITLLKASGLSRYVLQVSIIWEAASGATRAGVVFDAPPGVQLGGTVLVISHSGWQLVSGASVVVGQTFALLHPDSQRSLPLRGSTTTIDIFRTDGQLVVAIDGMGVYRTTYGKGVAPGQFAFMQLGPANGGMLEFDQIGVYAP